MATASDVGLLADLSGFKLLSLHRKQVTKIREPEGGKKKKKKIKSRGKERKVTGREEDRMRKGRAGRPDIYQGCSEH